MTLANVPLCRPSLPEGADRAVAECLSSGWVGYGPRCNALEERFTVSRGGFGLATSSCTSALYLAALLCKQGPLDEVIVPAMTFASTAMAFAHAGFRVVLADVNRNNLMLSLEDTLRHISPQTRAVVVVHLFGQRFDTRDLRQECDKRGLVLIEDCAHRLDILDGEGPLGDIACYSFNAVKEAPCGEGGMLWVRRQGDGNRARALSNVGMHVDTMQRSMTVQHGNYEFGGEGGLKLRSNDIAATLALASLDALCETRQSRKAIFEEYDRVIESASTAAIIDRAPDDSFLMYTLRVAAENRSVLRSFFAQHGVATSVHYPSLSRHPLFGCRCPEAERADIRLVTLPSFPGLTAFERTQVCKTLAAGLAVLDEHPI